MADDRRVIVKVELPRRGAVSKLSRMEWQVIALMAQGGAYAAIADELVVSENTVKSHMRSIFAKLGANSRHEAMILLVAAGLVEIRPEVSASA